MDLWIKHQDSSYVTKANSVSVEKEFVTEKALGCHFDGDCYNHNVIVNNMAMGTYETKERAEEVFNEIQSCIINLCCIENNPRVDGYYEMPKE